MMLQPVPAPPPGSHPPDSKGVVPLSTWVLISNFKLSYNLLRRPDGTFNRHLAEFLDRKVTANRVPVDGIVTMDVLIERTTGIWGRVFWEWEQDIGLRLDPLQIPEVEPMVQRRDVQQPKPLVIYFHGGSFAHSSANSAIYDAMCRRFAKTCGVVILSVNFRRAPENRYPCAYEDGVASLRWAQGLHGLACLRTLGCDPLERCFLAGDSSGGNIAHNVAVRAAQEGLPLAGSILLMPMFGGQARTASEMALDGKYFVSLKDRDWYWRAFLPIGADREHPACNPFSVDAHPLQRISLPPCLVVVGGYDILQDWQLQYVYGLKKAGKPVQVMFLEQATMGFFLLPNSDLFYSLVERLQAFVSAPQHDAA
ncbi:hypothetical protein L7F22_002852 [Adiantum nelumboides]|nr:hypothetical protein [Adiantum nelumboides]